MRLAIALVCLLSSLHGHALERNAVRQQLAIHSLTRSSHNRETFFAEEEARRRFRRQAPAFPSDDEDVAEDQDGSGEAEDSFTSRHPLVPERPQTTSSDWVWYRTKINFLDSIDYSSALQDYHTEEFGDLAHEIMLAVEEHMRTQLSGYHEATPLMFSMVGDDVMVMIDVGTCLTHSMNDVTKALTMLVSDGMIGRFRVSDEGFSIRQIGIDRERNECRTGPALPSADVATLRPSLSTTSLPTTTTEPAPPDFDVGVDFNATTTTITTASTAPPFRVCRFDQATCTNSQCIDRSYLCDGSPDCLDGSDEPESCSTTSSECDPTEFMCVGTGVCAQKLWRCDGDDDCGNGFDELDCPVALPGATCSSTEFECRNRVCIRSSYQCDGEEDCNDGSDEEGCSPPVVISPPPRRVNATKGETVTLECEAVGTPAPVISWRLNWANVPPPPRVTMTSNGGRGTLTIRKTKPSDQGAYTCEAINPNGSILVTPDTILTVEDNSDGPPDAVTPYEPGNHSEADAGFCPPGEFNTSPDLPDECKPCFCFGVTNQCSSSRLQFSEIGIEFTQPKDKEGVKLEPSDQVKGSPETSQPITENQIRVSPPARELQLIDLSKRFLAAAHYWSLPAQFLGAKINSYGGTLTFSFSYNNSYHVTSKPTNHSDVILEGNGKKLFYKSPETHPEPQVKHTTEVEFDEKRWKKSDGQPATREDMMEILGNLERILLRTVYDDAMLSTGVGDVALQVAQSASSSSEESTSTQSAGVIAYAVEECECPMGYAGLSCETCSPGYQRELTGPLIGKCVTQDRTTTKSPCDVGYDGDYCRDCARGYLLINGRCISSTENYCSNAGSYGMDFDLECRCKAGTQDEKCDKCKPGYYFLSASNEEGCLPCFCMGVSEICNSTTWNVTTLREIQPAHKSSAYFLLTNAAASQTYPDSIEFEGDENPYVIAHLDQLPTDVYYWLLPEEFTGNKLTSYGGNLDYTVNYVEDSEARPVTRIANVRITGNDITLQYVSDVHPEPETDTRFVVQMKEKHWLTPAGRPATREQLMMVLSNVESFIIRASYSNLTEITKLKSVRLGMAVPRRTGGLRAMAVEQCLCPPGYTGLSCEDCAVGYYRVEGGQYLGTCEPCNCHGHSSDCDRKTGICRNCRHDTTGNQCETCDNGFYGDATAGNVNDCQRCPCPTIEGRLDQGILGTCRANVDGEPVCDQCPSGYAGDRCERCAPGYVGNPLVLGSSCRRTDTSCQCDPIGSVDGTCDEYGQCTCKPSTTGRRCDQCKPGFFYLSVENVDGGCLPCFCMGLTKQCTSATYKRNEITSDFASDYGGFVLTQRGRRLEVNEGFELLNQGRTLSYPRVDRLPRGGPYYWQLPEEYLGDKIVSYGGKLKYKVSYTTYGNAVPTNDADVILIGNDITVLATVTGRNSRIRPNVVLDRSITFRENYWRRTDGRPATREHLLMALADVEAILIRATYSNSMLRTTIADVAMETASESVLMSEPAYEVEQCECPSGYEGLSCEDCAPGFTRSGGGIYLGLCHLCQCNGHADLCDSETGICVNCRDNTAGDRCDVCAPGYFGAATRGTRTDCQPCACPGTGENSFSDTCRLDASTNAPVCTNCREGYAGKRCERCARGYSGDPTAPGGRCVKSETSHRAGTPPDVTVSPKRVDAREGSSVTLRCSVTSRTPFAIMWRRSDPSGSLPSDARVSSNKRTLRLPSFSGSQAGSYECIAKNRYGTDRDTAVVTVARLHPMIKVRVEEPRHLRVRVGAQASFVCTATSKTPAYIVSWSKEGSRLPFDRVTDFDGILRITNVQLSDSGTYICTGSNMYTTDQETATLVVVQDNDFSPPTVEVTPHNQSIPEGDEARFYCTARGFPTPDIDWRRADGQPMSEGVQMMGNMLMIPSTSMADRSTYFCRASNPHGVVEARAALEVTAKGVPPTVYVLTPEVELTVGETAELMCNATGDPKPGFTWFKRGQNLPSNVQTNGGTLEIASATLGNQGIYSCTANNRFGQDSGYIRVTVGPKTVGPNGKPICRTEPKEVTAYVGTNSTITCVVGGNPLPEVTWETDDGTELDDNIQILGVRMFIYKVRQSNAGKYVCIATNQNGVSRSKMTLHVVKKDLPRVTITPRRRQKVKTGQSASFTCLAPGQIDADITWLRADQKLFTGETYLTNGNSRLNFHNVTKNEAGKYVCVASNVVGHRQASVYLHVTQPPVIRVKPATYIDLTEGEDIELVCNVDGVPTPSVVWLNATGGGSPRMLTNYRLKSNLYAMRNVKLHHAGDYYCRATSQAGNSQKKVVLLVHRRVQAQVPVVTVESSSLKAALGSHVRMRCIASGSPVPTITWSKVGGELPHGSTQGEGILHIFHLSDADGGVYQCTASNFAGAHNASVTLEILSPPAVDIRPSANIFLVPGQSSNITCVASRGSLPITYAWTKESVATPFTFPTSGGILQILNFEPERDVGTYTCTGRNRAGISIASLNIQKEERPTLVATPTDVTEVVGQSAEFICEVVANGNQFDVSPHWQRADGAEIQSERVKVSGGRLTFSNLQREDSAQYECVARNAAGSSSVSVRLTVHSPPRAEISTKEDQETFARGDSLTVKCSATGEPAPEVSLFKDDSELVLNNAGEYTVHSLDADDSGVYSCVATSAAGEARARKRIFVNAVPVVRIQQSSVTVRSGEPLILNCLVERTTQPNIVWTKQNGSLPTDAVINGGVLSLEAAGVNAAGVYVCTSTNQAGRNSSSITVSVRAFIPYFTQTPVSYMTVAIPDNMFYTMFNITVTFRPTFLDGLLFFSHSPNRDFISLSLADGVVEYRYDVGSGPVTLRSQSVVEKNQWHTVNVSRYQRDGQLQLDENDPVTGISPGGFRGLELQSDLYIGGVPSSLSLPDSLQDLGVNSGFFGCVSQLQVDRDFVDFGSKVEVPERVGVTPCKTCGENDEGTLCENHSICVESHAKKVGYNCNCDRGYVGERCQFKENELCNEDACSSQGTCNVDLERELGFFCTCNPGFNGLRCTDRITYPVITTMIAPVLNRQPSLFARGSEEVARPAGLLSDPAIHGRDENEASFSSARPTTPVDRDTSSGETVQGAVSFRQESYMTSDDVSASQSHRTNIVMRIRRRTQADGLLLFSGGKSRQSSFISLSIRNNALEFRFKTGSDTTILRAPTSVMGVGTWHTVRVLRRRKRGKLEVDGRTVTRARSSGPDQLVLGGPLYIGGAQYWEHVSEKVNVHGGFDGCIETLRIDGVDISFDLFTKKNTGQCTLHPRNNNPSENAGATASSSSKPRYSARFTGSSYVSYGTDAFSHVDAAEQISLRFRTTETDGLILFHGEDLVSGLKAASRNRHKRRFSSRKRQTVKDYVSLGVQDSYLVYTYELGGGQGKARSSFVVSDGAWHTATILRRGTLSLMWLDDLSVPVAAQSPGSHTTANTLGRVYVGGAPDVIFATSGRYTVGFSGCLRDIRLTSISATRTSQLGSGHIDDSRSSPLDFSPSSTLERIRIHDCLPDTPGIN